MPIARRLYALLPHLFCSCRVNGRDVMPRRMRTLLCAVLLLALAALSGCATRQTLPPEAIQDPAVRETAHALWQQYLHTARSRNSEAPFRIGASLRYSTPDSGHRLVLRAWGNGLDPMRIDIEAGVGQTLALIRQDSHSFVAYDPRGQKAYVNNDTGNVLLRFGLPVPFGIRDLGNLMTGRFDRVMPEEYTSVAIAPGGGFAYTLPATSKDGHGSVLRLNAAAQPEEWVAGKGTSRMALAIAGYDTPEALPRRFTIQMGEDKNAILLIRERAWPETPFSDAQLTVDIPAGTHIKPLPHN